MELLKYIQFCAARTRIRSLGGFTTHSLVAWSLILVMALFPTLGQGKCLGKIEPASGAAVGIEYAVRAAFLFNFARYVKWPETAFQDRDAPLIVAVLGKNPFDSILDDAFKGKLIGARPLVVKYFENAFALKACHLLYVPQTEVMQLDSIHEACKERAVLVVSETIAAATHGAHVGFYFDETKLRFAINETAAKAVKLQISSELMKLAKPVKTETAPK